MNSPVAAQSTLNTSENTSDVAAHEFGKEAALLVISEIGLGSVLHGFKIPFSGHFLSLNQILLLTRAQKKSTEYGESRIVGANISLVAALLKSLSPAGKKLTPMLAISAQGILFSLGTVFAGANLLGVLLGSVLLGLWAFCQPLLIYYIIFGQQFLVALDKSLEKIFSYFSIQAPNVVEILSLAVVVKSTLAVLACLLGYYISDVRLEKYFSFLKTSWSKQGGVQKDAKEVGATWRRILFDLTRPLFVATLFFTFFFFYFSEDAKTAYWFLLRSLTLGALCFYFLRSSRVYGVVERWRLKSNSKVVVYSKLALEQLRKL